MGPSEPRRLHPASLLFRLWAHVRALLIPGLMVWFATRDADWQVWLMLLFVPSVTVEVIRYISLRYRFGEGELVVTEGILGRRERHVPFGRIQNIDLVQGIAHRLLGVAEIRIQTATSGEPEADLKVLSLDAVEEIRRRVFADRRPPAGEGEVEPASPAAEDSREERTLLALGTGDLLRLSLVSNQGLAIVAVAIGAAWELNLFDQIDLPDVTSLVREQAPTWQIGLAVLGLGLGVAVVLFVLSVIWTFVRLYGFRLMRKEDEFRIECGLTTRRTATIPRRRVQLVSIVESPQHRLFKGVTIRVETAGGGEGDKSLSRSLFAPLVRRERVDELLGEIDPGLSVGEIEWQPLSPRAIRRAAIIGLASGLVVGTGVGVISHFLLGIWAIPVGACIAALVWIYEVAFIRGAAYAVTFDRIAYRSGVLWRRVSVVRLEKAQAASLAESPFDRRWRMASVRVDTAGAGAAGHHIAIPYLDRAAARDVLDRVTRRVARTALQW